MRTFLNAILSFIGAESLTDDEYTTYGEVLDSQAYNQATYDALAAVLESREAVSDLQDQLVSYFEAKGVDIDEVETGKSNILLGGAV